MTIDMNQFKGTYIEESLEGLDIMESSLLNLEPGSTDEEVINTIFRAAHSIKGGGATFDFLEIAGFTHVVETLLDEIRAGERELTQIAIELFLKSVDILRELLAAAQEGEPPNLDNANQIKKQLEDLLSSSNADSNEADTDEAVPEAVKSSWKISFEPHPHMLMTGNDVVRMFRELAELGELEVEVSLDKLGELQDLDPEECLLSWNISLQGAITEDQINEVFVWVEDDCSLTLTPLVNEAQEKPPSKSKQSTQQATGVKVTEKRSAGNDKRKADRRGTAETSSIRVGIDKIDALINMVGELVITQSMLSQLGEDFQMDRVENLMDGLGQLERNTRELQESVMRIRMIPISFAFNRFPRMIHDMSAKFDKKAQLKLSGESTELDKTVMEKIGDPLVHLVRNSMDHGIESPADRVAAGKPETGTVHLNAFHQGGNIIIEVSDDGAGLNKEKIRAKAIENGIIDEDAHLSDEKIFELLFRAGFSTADEVTDVSGRGVGMDVVKRNIQSLGGTVEVSTVAGQSTTFTIRLPLTLAILDGQLIRVGNHTYIIPLVSIIESLQIKKQQVSAIGGNAELYKLREEYLPIIRLYDAFSIEADNKVLDGGLLVVVEGDGQRAGLLVDDLLAQQQVVIKSLETNFHKVEGLSGATILGDGTVALIVDIAGVIRVSKEGSYLSRARAKENQTIENNGVAA